MGMKSIQAIIDTPFAQLAVQTCRQSQEFVIGIDFLSIGSRQPFLSSRFTELLAVDIERYLKNPAYRFEMAFLAHGTEFQQAVWQIMQNIEAGKTRTYGDVARELSSSPRAVGNACRCNPIPLLIPCHRIVAKKGIGGFAGHRSGDIFDIKSWLLRHEAGKFDQKTEIKDE